MKRSNPTPTTPGVLVKVDEKIQILQYAERVTKILPNLPKGRLRDEVVLELESIVVGSCSPLKELQDEVSSLKAKLQETETKLKDTRKLLDRCEDTENFVLSMQTSRSRWDKKWRINEFLLKTANWL